MRRKIKNYLCCFISLILVFVGGVCLWTRARDHAVSSQEFMLAAAALAMPDGSVEGYYARGSEQGGISSSDNADRVVVPAGSISSGKVYSEDPQKYDGETHYPVFENTYCNGEFGYNNFFVKNTTGYTPNLKEYLDKDLGFDFADTKDVQVLIVHTHTSESYLTYDEGYYHESFYPRSEDPNRNMIRVGEALRAGLEAKGIGVVHATEIHDVPEYDGAYRRSYDTIQKYLKKYPNIKVILDLHRDSISYGYEGGKVKPTFTANGKKAAQIMIMTGYDPDGSLDFPFWKDNLTFALKLQDTAENMYPGMTRPLYFGNFAYNMNINNGSLLIEVGTDVNTLEEAVYSGELLSNVLAKVLQNR